MTKISERLDKLFEAVASDLSDGCASVPRDFARRRLLDRMRKRARYSVRGLTEKAKSDFLKTNASMRNRKVTLDAQVERDARHFITVVLERVTSSYDEDCIQIPFHVGYIFDNWRFGPGASNGLPGTHTAEKIVQKMTCNGVSRPLVERLRRSNPYFARYDSENGHGVAFVRGSRLSTVPKNEDTERTIAIEPSGQMALQLAAGRYLEDALRWIGLDITNQQPLNKALAKRGSVDGSLATIDMKSASDMMSVDLVRRLLPPAWTDYLMRVRSQEIEVDGEWHELHMISTMGNGFTFPLMTLIICSLIYGYRAQRGGPRLFIDWSDTAVFGDDVIVPTHEYAGVCETLEQAGFVINHDKSFSTGSFRESCGGDYYEGVDVTPFYVKTLASTPDVYVVINQVIGWVRKTNIFLHRTMIYLLSLLRGQPYFVPEWLGPNQGILTSQVRRRYKYLKLVAPRVRFDLESLFAMPLACGGYIESQGPHAFFMPRPSFRKGRRLKYEVREARLPRGYLEGWAPELGDHRSSVLIASWLEALTS